MPALHADNCCDESANGLLGLNGESRESELALEKENGRRLVGFLAWSVGRAVRSVSSMSAFEISTGLVIPRDDSLSDREGGLALCAHRPRTPSIALKKFVEPTVNVRATASRAGASCCSSFSSCIPSCNRRPRSETTEGLSVQG